MTNQAQCPTCKRDTPTYACADRDKEGWLVCEGCDQAFCPNEPWLDGHRAELRERLLGWIGWASARENNPLGQDIALAHKAIHDLEQERDAALKQLRVAKAAHNLVVKERDHERRVNATLQEDRTRLDLLATMPREGIIEIDGVPRPCCIWAVTAAKGMELRAVLDVLLKDQSPIQ